MRAALLLLAGSALLIGCEEPKLPKSWRVTYARLLAVRAEVIGDPARATPEPGESVRMQLLIVGDQPIEHIHYALVACPATPARGELPSCAGEPFFVDQREVDGSMRFAHELAFEIDVPEEDALGEAGRVLIAGTFCTDGTPELVEGGEGRCAGGDAPPVTFTAHVSVALDEADVNHNPVLSDDAIRFDDEQWSPTGALEPPVDEDAGTDGEPDAGAAQRARADGMEHEIEISLERSAREADEGGPEELLLSHYVTAGVLGRRFSVLEREQDGGEPFRVKWHMPRVDDPPGTVLVVFVLRDQRGGVDYALRELDID